MGVNFDGTFLILPQAAARIDDTELNNINVDNGINVAIIGQAEGGEPNKARTFTDITSLRRAHIRGDIVEAAKKCFGPSAENPGANRIITIRANSATQSLLTLLANALPVSGTAIGSKAAPWNLEPGQILTVDVDTGGNANATFDAARANRLGSSATFAASASESLVLSVDGGANQSIIFGAGTETSLADYLNVINAQLIGGGAEDTGGEIDLFSDKRGTGSSIEVVSGTGTILAKIGHSAGTDVGTGDVADIDAVTFAEAKTVIEADIPGLTVTQAGTLELVITSDTTGASSSIQIDAGSTATDFGFDNALHIGSVAAPSNVIDLVSTDWGLHTSRTRIQIESGSSFGKKITIEKEGAIVVQDNVERKSLTIQYTGAGSAATVTIDDTSLATTVTGGPGGEDLALLFSNFSTLQTLCDFIDNDPVYTCIIDDVDPNRASADLDDVAAGDIQSSTLQLKSDLQAVIDALNSGGFTDFVVATKSGTPKIVPDNIAFQFLVGGTEGVLTNTEWNDVLVTLESSDVKIFCLLTGDSAVHAMGDTHATTMSNISNKKRRKQFAGGELGEKTTDLSNYLTRAFNLNSDRTSMVPFGLKDFNDAGVLVDLPPYIVAAQFAGLQAGIGVGEAMTHKFIRTQGIEFDEDLQRAEKEILLEGGLLFPEIVEGQGIRVIQGITTWLRDNKFNRVEVSVGQALDEVAETVEQRLDSEFIGQKADNFLLAAVVSRTESVLQTLQDQGIIVGDSENPAFKNVTATLNGDVIEVSFEVSPAIPANFILISVHAVPFSGTVTTSA